MILAPKGTRLDLRRSRSAWNRWPPVFSNAYLLQTEWEGHPVTLYADGRALVQGTDDPARGPGPLCAILGHVENDGPAWTEAAAS